MKIVFLGNSLTWGGYGADFVSEVARRLPRHEIINAGEGGNTILNLRRRLDSVLEQQPDGIFVMGGGNDAISASQPETRRYYERVQKVPDGIVTPELFTQTYRDLLTHIQMHHVIAWVGLAPMEHNPTVVAALQDYNARTREIAEALRIDVLDLMAHFPPPDPLPDRPALSQDTINLIGKHTREKWSDYATAQAAGGYTFTFDGLHLMPEVGPKVAELIVDFLDLPD